jgi:ElaA protein
MDLRWSCVRLDELSARELYAVLRLRAEVFVVEQRCTYLDPDGLDLAAWHLLGRDARGQLLAYARLLDDGEAAVACRIGRVIAAPAVRGTGLGRWLMQQALAHCQRLWPDRPVVLGAQAHLQGFYAGLGFSPVSDVYDEDGIPHIDMKRERTP